MQQRRGGTDRALVYMITPGYLAAMGVPVTGRDFSWEDEPPRPRQKRASVRRVEGAIPSSSSMKAPRVKLYPNGDAIGHVIDAGGNDARIVGTIPDVHQTSVEGQPDWQVYYPQAQQDPEGA